MRKFAIVPSFRLWICYSYNVSIPFVGGMVLESASSNILPILLTMRNPGMPAQVGIYTILSAKAPAHISFNLLSCILYYGFYQVILDRSSSPLSQEVHVRALLVGSCYFFNSRIQRWWEAWMFVSRMRDVKLINMKLSLVEGQCFF